MTTLSKRCKRAAWTAQLELKFGLRMMIIEKCFLTYKGKFDLNLDRFETFHGKAQRTRECKFDFEPRGLKTKAITC